MFVSQAFAQGAGGTGGDLFAMIVPLILIMAVFWFLLIRPQQKKAKEHQELVHSIRRGDVVTTAGGMIGKVARVIDDNEILLEVADNVRMRFQKQAIAELRARGEPVSADTDDARPKRKSAARKVAQKK
ncbi:MAG TPA: preprotein translocase subunit YajC [Aestuariivirgaceae bacterium]|nr:preprotein translocase subunit YajC [Aestuariivirgaceae bacterium]